MSELAIKYQAGSTAGYIHTLQVIPQQTFEADLFSRFIEYTDCAETTVKGYISYIRQFARWMQNNGITQPCRTDIKAYKEYLEGTDLAAGTQAQYIRAVKHFFKWTASEGVYPNIADNIKGAKIRQDIHKKDALSREDVPAIAETIDRSTEQGKRMYALYLLCITCGLRTIEVSRANIEDIRTIAGRTYLYIQGKGHTDKDAPVLLVPEVSAALRDYLKARTDKPTGKSPLIVSTSNRSKGQRIDPSTIGQTIKKMLIAAGYDSSRITAHSLRHTSGTGAYMATHDIYQAQQHQRHADPKTTEIYVHAAEREERNTEQQVYNYYFRQEVDIDAATEAGEIIKQLPIEKQKAALEMLRAML